MPEEEAKRKLPEVSPEGRDGSLESQQERQAERRESTERSESGESQESPQSDTSEPVAVKMPAAAATPSIAPVQKDPVLTDLENILADDLTDLFLQMPDDRKWEFKQKGEETASKIKEMLDGGKVKIKKIFDLIRDWLRIVPGVNKYFLEQEAKIKADNVLQYAQEQERASKNVL